MTIRLQQFGHRQSRYEQPRPKWVCGWAADGNPCRLGPDGRGRCSAAGQALCSPRREGDRWMCTRPELHGGPCGPGPRPDGSCCRPRPEQPLCQPHLSWRARRGRLSAACVALTIGALAIVLPSNWGHRFISPGPLMSAHAVVETAAPAALLRLERGGDIQCVAFAPDGGRLVSGGRDGTLDVWDAARGGAARVRLVSHTAPVTAVQFTADGNRVVSASTDGAVLLWDAARGGLLRTVREAGRPVTASALSSNGRFAASGAADGTIRVIDASSGEEQWTKPGPAEAIRAIAFSADGRFIASGTEDGTIEVRDAATGDTRHTLRHGHPIVTLAFSPGGARLASAADDRSIRIWDPATGVEHPSVHRLASSVRTMAFAHDGTRLASGAADGKIMLLDPDAGRELLTVPGHDDAVNAVAFSPDGRRVASGSRDGRIKLWKAATGEDGWPAWRAPPRAVHCHFCHVRQEGTGGVLQPVRDSACVSCHVAEAHHPTRSADPGQTMALKERLGHVQMARNCTTCHSEHHGRDEQPRRVPDTTCTACHADLAPRRLRSDAPHVLGLLPPRIDPPIETAVEDRITSLAGDHPEFDAVRGDTIDLAAIRFGHQVHMDPDSHWMQDRLKAWVETLKRERPEYEIPVKRLQNGDLRLSCSACHAPDATGRHMKPIRFEENCRHCHEDKLTWTLEAFDMADETERVVRFPHGSAIALFLPVEALQLTTKVIVKKERTGRTTRLNYWARHDFVADAAPSDHAPAVLARLQAEAAEGCSKCHSDGEGDVDPLAIAPPMIPERWFTRAAFNHESHRFVACLDCHAQAGPDAPPRDFSHAFERSPLLDDLAWTERTKEIMLPSIETCRECHAPPATAGASAVRHDCVLCHEYHVPSATAVLGGAVLARPVVEPEGPAAE